MVVVADASPHLLRRTLASLRNQQTPLLEILVVCVDPDARRIALSDAADDTRVRIVGAASVSDGRSVGVRRARGRRLVLATAGDVYLPGAVTAALGVADDGPVVLAQAGDPSGPTTLERDPQVAASLRLGRLVLAEVDAATLDDDAEGAASAARHLRDGFTLTAGPAYVDARSEPPPPHTPRADPLPGLAARVDGDLAVLGALDHAPAARSYAAAGALLGLRPFLEAAEVASPADWTVLAAHAERLWEVAGHRVDELDVVPRALVRLAALDRRDDLVALVTARRFAGADVAARVEDGAVYADLGVDLPRSDLLVADHESRLRACARRLLAAGDELVIELLAGVRHVDQRELPEVEAVLVSGERTVRCEVEVATDHAVDRWFGEAEHDHPAGLVRVRVPAAELVAGEWAVELTWRTQGLVRHGRVDELDHHGSAGRRSLLVGPGAVRLVQAGSSVTVRVTERGDDLPAEVQALDVDARGVHLTLAGEPDAVWLAGAGTRVEAVRQHGRTWTVPLDHDVWGLGERPLPSGQYRLQAERSGAPLPARLSAALVDRVPEETRTPNHRAMLLRGAEDGLVVRLEPALDDDEAGRRAQRVLQQEYARVVEPVDPHLVYFQSFTGQWVNDHPAAIQQELARRRSDLDLRWLVADASCPAPAGATAVLHRSRDWYDVLARAGHIVTNIELDRWFRRRPGQQILQTFHGYPSKTMGLGLWRSRGLLPSHLEQQLDHTSRTWNALLTPDPAMDEYYRREYAYDGRILALGYPRDDVLVGPDRRAVRTDTRHRLGIAPGQRAVLYAPTWRDDLATNFRAAEAVHHLDVEAAAAALGDDYVLLLRGHRFHASGRTSGSRVLDVTTYPDVNDLILAADVAVLDYSSMRFDVALTGRPMVFLVPDLDDYGSRTRGFLWDFGETAPGPWVRDTAGVVAALRDLDALAEQWADRIAAFNARYNSLQDGHAAERVVAEFFGDLPDPVTDA